MRKPTPSSPKSAGPARTASPYCPRCGGLAHYTYKARKLWKCKACTHQFSVTSGTIFASRKLAIRDYLMAIAILCNGAKGVSALQLGRDLDVQYRTAFVLCHKLREAMASEMASADAVRHGRGRRRLLRRPRSPGQSRKRIASTAGSPRTRPASAASWSWPASARAAPRRQ